MLNEIRVAIVGAWVLDVVLLLAASGTGYLLTLLAGAARGQRRPSAGNRDTRFAILVPAHDEASVIGATVRSLVDQEYPREQRTVYVVADYCSDDTAAVAREAGARCFERDDGPRGGKASALAWLLEQVRTEDGPPPDAIGIFDADTQVAPDFLRVIDAHLAAGAEAVQGRHQIANPQDGAYAALADAMMRIDNRVGNQGRVNLGASAKHMGDSIVFRRALLERYWHDHGLTEDYELRQRLVLEGHCIAYADDAVGQGEAPATWEVARHQRTRWLQGTAQANRMHGPRLLLAALRRGGAARLDAALQALLPAYSTLVLLSGAGLLFEMFLLGRVGRLVLWALLILALALYPWVGLRLDRAPGSAYRALVAGPVFVLWRSALAMWARVPGRGATWRRTTRRAEPPPSVDGA